MRRAFALALVVLAALPAGASAHAQLESTSPARGATLKAAPKQVVFRFGETVQAGIGSVRVFNGSGKEVQSGAVFHPGDKGSVVGVHLPASLPDGGYTATYHVISADSHPVSGGFSFAIGTGGAGAQSVDRLLKGATAGAITATAMGATRAVMYAAIALALGSLLFLWLCWRATPEADRAFRARLARLLRMAAVAGAVASVLGVLLEGAEAEGTSLWSALKGSVISEILGTRFGTTWGLALIAWLAVLVLAGRPRLAAVPVGLLALLPAFGGHASVEHPTWLFLPMNVIHVVCVSGWLGGIAVLVLALRSGTAAVPPEERTPLLTNVVGRFSTLAGGLVGIILATGVVQSLIEIDAVGELIHTGYGRAVLIKFLLFCGLLGFGYVNRTRILPALRQAQGTPGRAGVLLRRSLRMELGVGIVVLGVTGALATYAPAKVALTGPVDRNAVLGPARLELTVDPAQTGVNQIHLYLFERKSGVQWTKPKQVTATASLASKSLQLPIELHLAGPGHYVAQQATLPAKGDWRVKVTARVSAFDEFQTTVTVPVR